MSPRTVAIVPHTHWDREWYAGFQTFRLRLVDLLDELLPRLEADPSYAHFLLDGQMAVVDDYLAIRPSSEAPLRRLAASGRLAMGPWYILMDEFLVSGETMIRNLQKGLERAAAFGGAMEVGYLPDMFGHVAQMPQLLRQFGLEHTVVWRGVPSAIDRTAFWWTAPDGSTVRAEYLWHGYGNGASMPDDAKQLLDRIRSFEDETLDALGGAETPILWMNGTDHQMPQSWLGRVVAEVNDIQDDYHLVVTSLAAHVRSGPVEGLPSWTGELRSGARANLLMGVGSNRVDVKQAAARAEREIERLAEPLSALFLPPERWPGTLLDEAWMLMIRNSAHDSICACSIDEVCDAVLHRYAEAHQIGVGLTTRVLKAVAAYTSASGPVIVNPSARTRSGLVELELPGTDEVAGVQVLGERPEVLVDLTVNGAEFGAVIGQVRSQQLDEETFINKVEIDERADGVDVTLHAEPRMGQALPIGEIRSRLASLAEERADQPFHARIVQAPSKRVLARVEDLPGYGWRAWSPDASSSSRSGVATCRISPSGDPGTVMENGLVRVEVDPSDGTWSVDGVAGFGRLVDDGDHGDTYNYSPPENDVVVDRPDSVSVSVLEEGPLRARLLIEARYTWPERIVERSRTGERRVDVRTTLELHAGERLVRVATELDNPCRDHRLRAWFPLSAPVSGSRAECAFAVVERGLEAEGGDTERGLPTFPSRRFVQAGDLTVVHEGLLEYEVVDGGTALALTLLRATGMLSRTEMSYRPLPAGPPIEMEGPQVIGRHVLRYGVQVGEADPYALVDDAFLPLLVSRSAGIGDGPTSGQALSVEGAEVSALVRRPGGLELRVFNPSDQPTVVRVGDRSGWLVDLRGRPLEPFDGSFDLAPWKIATARFTD